MTIQRWAVRIHKWLALIVGIQIILWIVGGFGMAVLDIEKVSGEHLVAPQAVSALDMADLISPAEALAGSGAEQAHTVTLSSWMGQPVYHVEPLVGATLMVDARNGTLLSPIDEVTARRVALADHIAEPEIVSVEFLVDPPREYGRPGPVWQVNFEDGEGTRTYVSPATGQVVTHRNDRWRLFDFLWMLHIMDYEERDNFNHPLIISAAALAMFTVFAGLVLLFIRMRRTVLMAMARRD
ncbi:MAG: PepSY domain-containing protein [Maricaulis sp.]|uniref:PepSY domain-containing protein n=1 Tax=Maricaulis sp. TaxID=1486257 RepID=UPI00262771C9|nr:PepSY domain-containing protein [Maricaulis sp.]MDM7984683.1 PepSY domain-containing protein [Maricaulis sp.]